MSREPITGKSLMTAGAAAAFAGAALYATGQILSFLFRDVDPKRIYLGGKETWVSSRHN